MTHSDCPIAKKACAERQTHFTGEILGKRLEFVKCTPSLGSIADPSYNSYSSWKVSKLFVTVFNSVIAVL